MESVNKKDWLGELELLSSGEIIYLEATSTRLQLHPKLYTIGSDPAQVNLWFRGIQTEHTCISAIHCLIFYDHAHEAYMIKDSFSECGTFLNGDPLDPQLAVSLKNQDLIELGNPLDGGALLRFYSVERGDETARISNILPYSAKG